MDNKEIIIVRQLPVIEEQLRMVRDEIEKRVNVALSLVCNEETYKEVKKIRSELSKEYGELELRRKEVKAAILAPYEQFEKAYKECAGNLYSDADAKLKARIADVECSIKQRKSDELASYFEEYRISLLIPDGLVSLSDVGIKIALSDSKKALHEKVKAFLDRVSEDLALIDTQELKDEILVEYHSCLNAAKAITSVCERHKAIEEERRNREAAAEAKVAMDNAVSAVLAAAKEIEDEKETEAVSAPDVICNMDTTYVVKFRVEERGEEGINKLRALKKFLKDGGYNFEQLD